MSEAKAQQTTEAAATEEIAQKPREIRAPRFNIINNNDELFRAKPMRCYILGVSFLRSHFTKVEFQATGDSVRNTLDAVNRISDSGLATIKKFKTGVRNQGTQVLPKITVVLEKSQNFEEAFAKVEHERESRRQQQRKVTAPHQREEVKIQEQEEDLDQVQEQEEYQHQHSHQH